MPRRRHPFTPRKSWQHVVGLVGLYAVATGLLAGSPEKCVGYQPAAADEVIVAENSAPAVDESVLSHSAAPLRDRTLQEHVRRARTMIERREFAPAVAALREAASRESNAMILTAETPGSRQQFRGSHSVIEDLLLSLPKDALSIYLNQAEPLARSRFLLAVRESNFEALRQLALQFPLTIAARDALHMLAARHLDRREFAAADAVVRRLARHPNLPPTQREAVLQTINLSSAYSAEQRTTLQSPRPVPEETLPGPIALQSQLIADDDVSVPPLLAKLFPDLGSPDWQVHSGLDDETTTLARHALHEHFEQSIPILPRAQPLIVDEVVLRRSPIQISAHDLQTGRLLWSVESESDAGQTASRLAMNLSLQELMSQRLARGLQVDSLQSRLSSDGERVFTVESRASSTIRRLPSRSGLLDGSPDQSQSQNRIVARQLRTGKVAWNMATDAIIDLVPTGRQSDSSDIYFCGLPTSVDRNVVGLVQVGELLRLYAVDQNTGRIDWSIDIAEAARHSPSDADWRSLDCRITLVDGVLVCPTGSGLLVGVDLATRSVIWSRRYSRADIPLEVTKLPFAPTRPQRPWWQGWRDFTLLSVKKSAAAAAADSGHQSVAEIAENILIAVGPDAEGLNAIDPRSGESIWYQPVQDPVELISAGDRIIVVSRHFVVAFKADSGETLWRVPCREPVGTGYGIRMISRSGGRSASTFHVFPTRGGVLVAVNSDDGQMIESIDRLESLTGCLISAGSKVISLNLDRLTVWPMLSTHWSQAGDVDCSSRELIRQRSTANDAAIELATVERSSGLFEQAATRLRTMLETSEARRELQRTLIDWLNSRMLSSSQIPEVTSEFEQLAGETAIADLIAVRHAAARAAAESGDPVTSLNFYAKLQSLNPSGEPRFLKPEPLRSVRHDRLIQGEVIDLMNNCNAHSAEQLTQIFSVLAESAATSRDPFALQRFARQWYDLPIAARHVIDERSRIGLRYDQKLLALQALAESKDRNVSEEASSRLVELYDSRSYNRDAAAVQHRLQRGLGADSVSMVNFAASPWNAGPATVSEHPEQNLDTTFIPVPVECQPGTLFDRLNVVINPRSSRDETVLRFYGDGISGYWQTVLATSASPLKSVGRLYRGWGIGHFLVLQLGAELFGISPFDGSGEPRVQRLWSIDLTDGNRQEDHQYAPAVPGFHEEELTMLDAFGRPLATVGPVRAGYLCFQTRGKLVCLDTYTGQRLWQRYELPRQAICAGDRQNVFMIQPNEDVVTVLRVVDGATVSQFHLSDAVGFRGTVLRASGDQVLIAERSSDSDGQSDLLRISRIVALNLQSAEVDWAVGVDPESTVFSIGPRWLGILPATGELAIIDSTSGRNVASVAVQRPQQIRAVHVSSDASSHVVALSETAESSFLNGRAEDGGPRNPLVTGQLLAIDAIAGRLLWQHTVDRIRFLLDQPKNAPCVVLNYRHLQSRETGVMESVLHVMNRETGADILNRRDSGSVAPFTFEPHADQNRLSIRLARKSIRITFESRLAR